MAPIWCWGSGITPAQSAWCARYINAAAPDGVFIDTIFRSDVLRQPGISRFNSIIIAHDVFHRRYAALVSAGYRVRPAGLSRAVETDLLNRARGIAAIQPEEAAAIEAMCPTRQVFTLPMPATPCPRPPGTTRQADRLVFVGSASLPNLDGLRWFFEAVWPNLRRWRHNISLDLVGGCGPALPQLPEGVAQLGQVPVLAPVLHRAALAISPLRVGSGLKIKLLDYARHGLMTVATPPSLQGFAADPAPPFITASSAMGFSAAVIRQLDAIAGQDERATDYVTRHYGLASSFAGLRTALALPADASSEKSTASSFPSN